MNKHMKILIVDDFPTMRRIIRNLLSDIGFSNTREAADGITALTMLQREGFDLLITDSNMPGMPGMDLLKALRTDARLQGLPVLMVTAESRREQILEAVQLGADGCVVKPFTAGTLEQAISGIFGRVAA